jgi:hypothetical protein
LPHPVHPKDNPFAYHAVDDVDVEVVNLIGIGDDDVSA